MGKKFYWGRGKTLQVCITITCLMAFTLMGYDQGVFSSVVNNQDLLDKIGNPNDVLLGIVVASYNLGCFSGSIFSFAFAEKLGRRKSMWVAMVFIKIGAALQASAYTRAHLVVGRYICGIGTGIETSTVPVYQSELSHAKSRGRLVSTEAFFSGVGIAIAYWFDYGMTYAHGPVSWRLPIACQIILAMFTVVMVFGVPESPRYLYKEGRNQEALEVLCAVWDKEPDDLEILKEQAEILEALRLEMEHGEYKWRNVLQPDRVHTRKRLLLSWLINSMNQLVGINLVVYYVPTVLHTNVGLSSSLSQLLGGIIQCMFVLGAVLPCFLADKYGRRNPMMWGCAGMSFSMMMITILLSLKDKLANPKPTSTACIAFFFIFMLVFGASVSCITWVYGPEILPLHARAKGNALGVSGVWIWNFFMVMITPVLINRLQWKTYVIFTLLNFVFVPTIYFWFPETTNLSLEEIDWIFTQGKSPVRAARELQKIRKEKGTVIGVGERSPRVSVLEVDAEEKTSR